MAEVHSHNTDYVRFYLDSELLGRIKMVKEPGNWRDDELELDRSNHHGIFNKFTNALEFYKEYRDFIENTFQTLGQNSYLYLIKEELREVDNGDVVWKEAYRGKADWTTKKIEDGVLKIRFNSDEIEQLVKANEKDDLEIESTTSIDDIDIGEFETFKTSLKGRNLVSKGVSVTTLERNYRTLASTGTYVNHLLWPPTEILSQGPFRHAEQANEPNNFSADWSTRMFYVDQLGIADIPNTVRIKLEFKLKVFVDLQEAIPVGEDLKFVIALEKYQKDASPTLYNLESRYDINDGNLVIDPSVNNSITSPIEFEGVFETEVEVEWNEGLAFSMQAGTGFVNAGLGFITVGPRIPGAPYSSYYDGNVFVNVQEFKISINEVSYFEPSYDLNCTFVHDVCSRMMALIANDPELFYSKYFGRTELGYAKDGPGGLIGLMHGYWIRDFKREMDLYKSPVFAWDKLVKSLHAVFAIGIGTQIRNNKKIFRVEEIGYFYQPQVVIRLGQVSNVKREFDKNMYWSGLEFGYSKGGDYENEAGLDEPNVRNKFTTPDRLSTKKYRKVSDIRADETEMEIIRRKPAILNPKEDTSSDEHNWFLDLKRTSNPGQFEQVEWNDRLDEIPSGIDEPLTFRSFFLTPLRMLFRHGWIIRTGLETLLNKKIKFASSNSNPNLTTDYQDEDEAYTENIPEGLLVSKLKRSRLAPEIITFDAKITQEILDQIYGYTRIFYEGEFEDVPNYYFKVEWINEKQEKEYGYILNMKPKSLGKFTMQKSNERPI